MRKLYDVCCKLVLMCAIGCRPCCGGHGYAGMARERADTAGMESMTSLRYGTGDRAAVNAAKRSIMMSEAAHYKWVRDVFPNFMIPCICGRTKAVPDRADRHRAPPQAPSGPPLTITWPGRWSWSHPEIRVKPASWPASAGRTFRAPRRLVRLVGLSANAARSVR